MKTKIVLLALILPLTLVGGAFAANQIVPRQRSAGPNADLAFMAAMQRDILSYLSKAGSPAAQVDVELLRDGPTITGLSFPKYYVWVRATGSDGDIIAGAMRIAETDTLDFHVTDYLTAGDILKAPDRLATVFPAKLIPTIHGKAGIR